VILHKHKEYHVDTSFSFLGLSSLRAAISSSIQLGDIKVSKVQNLTNLNAVQ